MSYSEFNVTKPTIHIKQSVFKQKHIKYGYVLMGQLEIV